MADTHHTVYFELREALAGPSCALCTLALRSMRRYFETLGYESVNDPGIRDAIRAARGFCEVHGRMLREARDALGTAIIHRDVIMSVAETLGALAYRPTSLGDRLRQAIGGEWTGGTNGRVDALTPQQPCPACARRQRTDQIYVDALLQHLGDDDLLPRFRDSAGLCLPHLRLALERALDAATFERLRDAQTTIWQRLVGELDEFIRKHDHRFAAEPPGDERTAWSRAVDLVSGQFGLGCASGKGSE
ncbi:MAG TPA: DUF6062 family protein [Roseiflexaceae bacterium]|jgi:hypothetical protein